MRGILLSLAAIAATSSVPASATTMIYDLSVADSAAGIAAGLYGTVTVQESAGSLIVTELLNAGFRIHDGNSNHNALSFSLVGDPGITISNLTSGFAQVAAASVSAPPFGDFDYAIDCTACGPGYGGGFSGPLSFTVTANSGSLSLASLDFNIYNGGKVFFASDVVDSRGKTGNVGAVPASAVPEPATWAMMLGGFGLVGASMRRRRQGQLRVA